MKGYEGLAYIVDCLFEETVSEEDYQDSIRKNVAFCRAGRACRDVI